MMLKRNTRITIFDSTLRDGAQGEGINFSLQDKLAVVKSLDRFGVRYIEAGNPGSNPKDAQFFAECARLKLKNAEIVAFGATRRKNTTPDADANVQSLLAASFQTVAVFGKAWDLHVADVLNASLSENLAMIEETAAYFHKRGKTFFFDAEHFFDGYKNNPAYALDALRAALRGGADALILCDTNGGARPDEIRAAVQKAVSLFPAAAIGIHCHNDGGLAVANSIAAVEAGARQVQGTFTGCGERCGNANLSTIIPALELKYGCKCLPARSRLSGLTAAAREIAEIANVSLENGLPYVGLSAFAHKAGMHADGVLKSRRSFEHIPPESVGNERRFLMSEVAGRSAVLNKLREFLPALDKDGGEAATVLKRLKELELSGYQFESADASFMLMAYKALGLFEPSFELISFKVITETPAVEGVSATATIKIRVGGKTEFASGEGDGPVNALDKALRKALLVFYPRLSAVSLTDYKVRVLDTSAATAANVRVLITSTDGKEIWTTIGVSTDIIKASWLALSDSVEYKLMRKEKGK